MAKQSQQFAYSLITACLFFTAIFFVSPRIAHADPIPPAGSINLTGAKEVRYAPPTLADLDGDGNPEIIIGTADGKVYALNYSAAGTHLSVLWVHDTTVDLGSPTAIRGATSVGDLDGDGQLEAVIPVGDAEDVYGGIVTVDGRTGTTKWIYRTYDKLNTANNGSALDGKSDAVVTTPALGDLDNDGKLEIVFGAFDFHVHAIHSDGSVVLGWPRFVRDTVWSSPALADLDNDGFLEVIIGTDAHAEGAPFNTPNGGCLHVYRGDGSEMPNWPRCIDQVIYSSPAVGDLDGDGTLEIVHGTGENYNNPAAGNKVYAWNAQGQLLWTGATSGYPRESPALGDINGDGKLETVVGGMDGRLYAWKHDGTPLWNIKPTNFQGNSTQVGSPMIAQYNTADNLPDVFINVGWDGAVVNGPTGAQFTANSFPNNPLPAYLSGYTTAGNAPAIGDLDGDGKLELVLGSANNTGTTGQVAFWRLSANVGRDPLASMPWPMFGQNPLHTRLYPRPLALDAVVVSHDLPQVMLPGEQGEMHVVLKNVGSQAWQASTVRGLGAVKSSDPFTTVNQLSLDPGEVVPVGHTRAFTIAIQAPATEGYYVSDWRMLSSAGSLFGRAAKTTIKVGNQPSLAVLTTNGVIAGGLSSGPMWVPQGYTNWPAAVAWSFNPAKRGYYLLETSGGVWYAGEINPLVSLRTTGQLRDLAIGPNTYSYYKLVGDGRIIGCDEGACNLTVSPAVPTGIAARSFAFTKDHRGVYVVDGFGNVYRGGTAATLPLPSGLPLPADIIRRIKLTSDGAGFYLMDIHGHVYNGGRAPVLKPNYTEHTGEDWARDFELTEDGTGFYLLDKNNGIHSGGTASDLAVNVPSITTGDTGRDLELLDGRQARGMQVDIPKLGMLRAVSDTAPITLTVKLAASGGSFRWTATTPNASDLLLSPTSGSIAAGSDPQSLQISLKRPGQLPIGQYHFVVNITGVEVAASAKIDTTWTKAIEVQLEVVSEVQQVYLPLAVR